jgi:uncharacterized protein
MKRIFLQLMLLCTITITAQTQQDQRKFIEVNGSAEMSVQPDDIELQIVLGKYVKNKKAVDMTEIETAFNEVLKKNNIGPENVVFEGSSYWYWWHWWKNRYTYGNQKTVKLKLDAKTDFLKLLQDLNTEWVQSIDITETSSREITRLRKEVKIQAIKAAKEKATYLLESIGEKVGGIISVVEMPDDHSSDDRLSVGSNSILPKYSGDAVNGIGEIRLRYEIYAKFEIQ